MLIIKLFFHAGSTFVDHSANRVDFFNQTMSHTLETTYMFWIKQLTVSLMPISSFMRTVILYSRSGWLTCPPAPLRDSFRLPAATWHLLWPPAVSFHKLYITRVRTHRTRTHIHVLTCTCAINTQFRLIFWWFCYYHTAVHGCVKAFLHL